MWRPEGLLSEAEKKFLLDGIRQGIRNDGRKPFDYRRMIFETEIITTAAGSCRLRAGETDIIIGIKTELGKPHVDRLDRGHFQIAVDCAASVSRRLVDSRDAEDWGKYLATMLEVLIAGDDVVDRKALCVVPGLFAWEVYADFMVLSSGGNMLDMMSLALCICLSELLLPKITIMEAIEEGEPIQMKVDDRPELGTPFPLKKMPFCITVAQLQECLLLDVTNEEELCADSLNLIVVDGKTGEVIGMQKLGRGIFDLNVTPSMLEHCKATAAALMQNIHREVDMPFDEEKPDEEKK